MGKVVELTGVSVRRGERMLLDGIDLVVDEGERWVVIGPNGAGKTTLLSVISARMFPTAGYVRILDEELGGVDLAELKPRIGWATSALAQDIPPAETVRNAVITGAYAVTGRWREEYAAQDVARAQWLMRLWGIESLAENRFGTLSEGERKRALVARALMPDPELLLLDEPGAGLDLGGREDLVRRLSVFTADPKAPALVMVTHHVEEIAPGFTHALVLSAGRVIAAGPIDTSLTSVTVSAAFGMPIEIRQASGRWTAQLAGIER